MLNDSDVAVVGGGVIGCSVAYYLARQGARVTVIERGRVGGGASSANSGVISLATKKPGLALDLAIASQRMFEGLGRELGADVEYSVDGGLIVAENETEAAFLEELVAAQQAAGAPVELVSGERCRELNPLLEGRVLSGTYCATDAQTNPFKVVNAFARAAEALGARILHETAVESIETAGARVTGVRTSRGEVRARWVVNAAGAHAAEIGKHVGVAHEVIPRRGQIVVLEATDALPSIRVSSAGTLLAKHRGTGNSINAAFSYTRKPLAGTVLLGGTNEFAGFDTRTTRAALGEICRLAIGAMPRLRTMNALRSWAGLRPYSAKGPVLGAGGGPEGYAVAIGHGGDGVALSPITGLYLSEYIGREGRECDLGEFLARVKAMPASGVSAAGSHAVPA